MSTENRNEKGENKKTLVTYEYADQNRVSLEKGVSKVRLFGDGLSEKVSFDGKIKDTISFREAMAALYSVVRSDYRYHPKDRSAYLEYMKLRSKTATANQWDAQKEYFSWLQENDPEAWMILDPIVSVHPDEIFFEVFSKDESTYAKLSVDQKGVELLSETEFGTTHIDFSDSFFNGIEKMRSSRDTFLTISKEGVRIQSGEKNEVFEKRVQVPDSWIRGLLQIQSAATLSSHELTLSPVDFYNILRHLRLNKDQKGKRRGLRFELVPGECPKVVLEPWETLIECTSSKYSGHISQVIRIWGRRRLLLAKRFLPFAETIDVALTGSGLPSFFILKGKNLSLSIGLSGFIASSWSGRVSFDLMLPRKSEESDQLLSIMQHLSKNYSDHLAGIEDALGLKGPALLKALQRGCQNGLLMYDMAKGVYRLRPLFTKKLDLEGLTYQNDRDRYAHDLMARKKAVVLLSENRIYGSGLELKGKVESAEDRREYQVKLLVNDDGQVTASECSCTFYRKNRMKKGPCAHQTALWILYVRALDRKMNDETVRKRMVMETKTFTKRDQKGVSKFQVTLDQKRLKVKWQEKDTPFRMQQILHNSIHEARTAYFEKIETLELSGWLLEG